MLKLHYLFTAVAVVERYTGKEQYRRWWERPSMGRREETDENNGTRFDVDEKWRCLFFLCHCCCLLHPCCDGFLPTDHMREEMVTIKSVQVEAE